MAPLSIGAIRGIMGGGFNPLKDQFVHRTDIHFGIHLLITAINVTVMTLVTTTSWWIVFTKYNSINAALAFVSIGLIPTTLLVSALLPRSRVPPLWLVGLGLLSTFVAMLVNLAFIIIFTDAAWGTGVWENETMTLIYETSQGLMLAIWFIACTFSIPGLGIVALLWGSYIVTFFANATPAGWAARAGEGFVKRIFGGSPIFA